PYRLIGPSEDGKVDDLLAEMSEREARQRMQALIAEWLRMENLVVLTAAGTSVSQGGQTMGSMENSVLRTVAKFQGIPAEAAAIIEQRHSDYVLSQTDCGFEDWLTYLANSHVLMSEKGSPFSGMEWK